MAYTAYRTWTTGEIVTAALMNEQVRDNGLLTAPAIMTTAGDIMYASAANTPARLAKSTTSTQYLANTGTSNVPAWNEVALATGVSGTLPVGNGGTGITSLGSNVATFLGTPSSANLRSALTDETGTGAAVFGTSPTLVTPALGTPASGVLTNATGLPEAGLAVSNSPTNGYMLTAQSGDAGGMTWAAAGGVTLSGSTNNTIATVTGSNALAGEANLTYSTDLSITSGNIVIATAGKGIDFSAQTATTSGSTDVELLDHYEEGTFTPNFSDSSGGTGTGQSYHYRIGHYVKIGKMCWFQCRVSLNLGFGGLSGDVYVSGLPFTSLNVNENNQAIAMGQGNGWGVTAGYNGSAYIMHNAVLVNIHLWDTTVGSSPLQYSELSADGGTTLSGCYMCTA